MVRRNLAATAAFAVVTLVAARGAEPSHYRFSPQPPGAIVQSLLFYPAGEGMQSQWRAVASRVHLGASAYQWYLSIYAIDFDAATYRLVYQAPRDGHLLSRVTRARGGPWLPLQSLHVVGAGEFERSGVQDLVVQTHEASADCGEGRVTVFTYDWTQQRMRPVAQVENGCALAATILRSHSGDSIVLAGPYYAPDAALCCPTKVRVVATLRYRRNAWVEKPKYFALTTP